MNNHSIGEPANEILSDQTQFSNRGVKRQDSLARNSDTSRDFLEYTFIIIIYIF
jgi:hypothetical protein